MTPEEHKQRHEALHQSLDELVSDWITVSGARPSQGSVLDLLRWSHAQTMNPQKRGCYEEHREVLAAGDEELINWMRGIQRMNAGDFLKSIAVAALRADWENYPLMRPILLELKSKYPQYDVPIPEGEKQFPPTE